MAVVDSKNSTWTPDQVSLIKRQVAQGATDDELTLFLYQARKSGLDPLAKQIYFQKRGSRAVFITAIDGFRLVASRTHEHAGTDDAVFDDEERPSRATVTVYRLVGGNRHPFTATARWSEYCPPSGQDHMWMKMPCTMLAKCAEALALRKAFPQELGGIYSKEEMDQADLTQSQDQAPAKPIPTWVLSEKQLQRLFAIAHSSGWDTVSIKALLKEKFMIESSKRLSREQYDELCKFLEANPKKAITPRINTNDEAMKVEVEQEGFAKYDEN